MKNKDLKQVYDEMHSQGPSSWFGQGQEERELILRMGEPWRCTALEIGCGEGDLIRTLYTDKYLLWPDAFPYMGIDYSPVAIQKAKENSPDYASVFKCENYRDHKQTYPRIIMQGVLEHLDDPFTELKWMMDNLLTEKGDVITSSPCFLNPRGIVWMTLDKLGGVMSKTDLHYLDPNHFLTFCRENEYNMVAWNTCDFSWGCGKLMVEDLKKRIPLALRDGGIPFLQEKIDRLLKWLEEGNFCTNYGATAVYHIKRG